LLSVSIQDIRPSAQDTSNFYLANIYQLLAEPNRSNVPTSLPASPPPFSPPTYAVWVNGLWFMSLVISISCAVLATLLQQWARRYLRVTQARFGLHKRARIRTFFAEGVEKSFLPRVVEALPTLIHVSLVLFFAGLAVFLWNVNLTIFKLVLSWIGLCTALYGCTMLISFVCRDSPYFTPLTPLALAVIFVIGLAPSAAGMCYGLLLYWTGCSGGQLDRFRQAANALFDFVKMIFMAPEKVALKSPPELDTRALVWTFSRLDEDHELARFFSGLLGFHTSKVVTVPLYDIDYEEKWAILRAMIGFLDRTFSSNLSPDRVKHRVDICEKAIDLLDPYNLFLEKIFLGLACANSDFGPVMGVGPAQSTEIVQFVRRWGNRTDPAAQALFSMAVARVKEHDDSWFVLASDALGIPEADLRSHAKRCNDLSFVILIHIIRQQFIYLWTSGWRAWQISGAIKSASQFDVLDPSPELRHEFCALWNQIVRTAQNDYDRDHKIPLWILCPLRSTYIALHQGTDSAPAQFSASAYYAWDDPSLYPLCIDPSHILDESARTTFPRTIQHYDHALAIASRTIPAAPSLSAPPPHVDENIADVPSLDDSHLTPQPVDGLHISLTSLGPSNAGAIQDIVTSGIATPYSTPETSTSAPPRPSTTQPAAVSLHEKVDLLTPSDPHNSPSTPPDPILDDVLPTGSSLSSHSPITQSDQSPYFPDSHPSIIGKSAPSASLVLTPSGPDPGTPSEDGGGPIPILRQENDAPDAPSVRHAFDANTIPTPLADPSPQSSSPPLVTESDVAIPGGSPQGPNVGQPGDRPPDLSHHQYDMV
jgi:hypothetical protein